MKKSHIIFCTLLISILLICSGCTDTPKNKKTITISANEDSEYIKTFRELSLGLLFDFDFSLPYADNRWTTLWVERYENGEKDSDPLTVLSLGMSPESFQEGKLGFGILNANAGDAMVFLYAPGGSTAPTIIEKSSKSYKITSWDYAIGDKEVEIKLDEPTLLAVHKRTSGNTIKPYDYQDEDAIQQMINENEEVLLLKIKVEEVNEE